MKTVEKLATVLLTLLQTSHNIAVEQLPCEGWLRPRPSRVTFYIVHALRLLAWFKGWTWTSDVLIRAHLWPILQSWNAKRESVKEATVMAVVRLLGQSDKPHHTCIYIICVLRYLGVICQLGSCRCVSLVERCLSFERCSKVVAIEEDKRENVRQKSRQQLQYVSTT